MNTRVGVLEDVAGVPFNPTQIGSIAFVVRSLNDARQWNGITGALLRPAAVYETAELPPEVVSDEQQKAYLTQLDQTMPLFPIGSIPYVRAYLIARLGNINAGKKAMHEASLAIPGKVRVWKSLLEIKAKRGDPVAKSLLSVLPQTSTGTVSSTP